MVKQVKVTVLAEDVAGSSQKGLVAKHGLSLLLEVDDDGVSLLMDTGPSPDVVLHNTQVMGIDLSKIDAIFLSHGHYDHTGGLVGLLQHVGKKVPVVAHPKVFDVKLKIEPYLKHVGTPFKTSEVEAAGGLNVLAQNPVTIMRGVSTSGEVERNTPYEKVTDFWTIDGRTFKEDMMPDDQAVIIEVEQKGLVIVAGCAHAGIINTIRQAQKLTGGNKIYAVLGGFHLTKASDERIRLTVQALRKTGVEVVGPCHCTGSQAVYQLSKAFKDGCKPLKTGDTLEL